MTKHERNQEEDDPNRLVSEEPFGERQRALALRHPLRRSIYALLERKAANIDEVAGRLEVPRARAAYHVRYLSRLQLIDVAGGEDTFESLRLRYAAAAAPPEGENAQEGLAATEGGEALADVEDALASARAAIETGTLPGEIPPSVATLEVDLDEDAWPELVAIAEEAARRVLELAERTEVRREKEDILSRLGRLVPIAFTVMGYEAAPPPG